MESGIYRDVSFETYLGWEAVSASKLKLAARSMAHYHAYQPQPSTPEQEFGALVHSALLEPRRMSDRYVVLPPFEEDIRRPDGTEYANVKATVEYKRRAAEFREKHTYQIVITVDQCRMMREMAAALEANQIAMDYLVGGHPEVSLLWEDPATGQRCKGRLDKWRPDLGAVVELKTTRDALSFDKHVGWYSYHRQAAFYWDGLAALGRAPSEYILIAMEKDPPYGCRCGPLEPASLDQGRAEYQDLLRRIADCEASGQWPGYENPQQWRLQDAAFTLEGMV